MSMLLVIKKVSSNFALVFDGEYNLGHWRKIKPITHMGIKKDCIAFFHIPEIPESISSGELSTNRGWTYYSVFSDVEAIKIVQLIPIKWEKIEWKGKELTRNVPPLSPNPNRERKRESKRPRYRW